MSGVEVHKSLRLMAEAMIAIGILAMSVAPLVLAIELGEWLSSREWPGWSVEDGLGLFGIERGETAETPYQRGLDVLMAIPLTLALFMIGVNLFLGGFKLGEWELDRLRSSAAPAGLPSGWPAKAAPAPTAAGPTGLASALVWARTLFRARRAETGAQYERALNLLVRASILRQLRPHDRVGAAMMMLRTGRQREAEASFRRLSRQFASSADAEQHYLDLYCRAMVAMLAADTADVLARSKEAQERDYPFWLRQRFPLPPLPGDY